MSFSVTLHIVNCDTGQPIPGAEITDGYYALYTRIRAAMRLPR